MRAVSETALENIIDKKVLVMHSRIGIETSLDDGLGSIDPLCDRDVRFKRDASASGTKTTQYLFAAS